MDQSEVSHRVSNSAKLTDVPYLSSVLWELTRSPLFCRSSNIVIDGGDNETDQDGDMCRSCA